MKNQQDEHQQDNRKPETRKSAETVPEAPEATEAPELKDQAAATQTMEAPQAPATAHQAPGNLPAQTSQAAPKCLPDATAGVPDSDAQGAAGSPAQTLPPSPAPDPAPLPKAFVAARMSTAGMGYRERAGLYI
ncbi:MAG: hypothetical protein GX781_07335, partial [Clostridiales bacterium]|nr:hypothetical protein [Clostridiales bacterium]